MTSPARLRGRRADHRPVPVAPLPPQRQRAGFVLYVSLPDDQPDADGPRPSPSEIAETADLLRELAQEALPGAETFTALSIAPGTSGSTGTLGERLTHLRLLDPVPDTAESTPDVLGGSGDAR